MKRRDILKGAVALAVAPAATLAAPPLNMALIRATYDSIVEKNMIDRIRQGKGPFDYSRELPRRRQGTPVDTSKFIQTYSVPLRSPIVLR